MPPYFFDDVVFMADSTSKLQGMFPDIHDISKPVGRKLHLEKTKVMCNKHVNKDDVIVDGEVKEVDRYVYFEQMVTENHDQVQKWKGESDRDEVHSTSWTISCE